MDKSVEQNEVAGILQNFSKMEHSCRKCLFSRHDLENNIKNYEDMHAKYHVSRTNDMLNENYNEKTELGVTHVNGVAERSLYYDFPFFDIPAQLPQCASHDLLEGCAKMWLLLILEHFIIDRKWLKWESLEHLIRTFPYKGRDCNSRPAVLLARKMKNKNSRKVIGTFAEIENFI